jgi:hypothetical protein
MIFGQLEVDHEVLKKGEAAVSDVLISRHSSGDGILGQNPRTEDTIINVISDHGCHGHDE